MQLVQLLLPLHDNGGGESIRRCSWCNADLARAFRQKTIVVRALAIEPLSPM